MQWQRVTQINDSILSELKKFLDDNYIGLKYPIETLKYCLCVGDTYLLLIRDSENSIKGSIAATRYPYLFHGEKQARAFNINFLAVNTSMRQQRWAKKLITHLHSWISSLHSHFISVFNGVKTLKESAANTPYYFRYVDLEWARQNGHVPHAKSSVQLSMQRKVYEAPAHIKCAGMKLATLNDVKRLTRSLNSFHVRSELGLYFDENFTQKRMLNSAVHCYCNDSTSDIVAYYSLVHPVYGKTAFILEIIPGKYTTEDLVSFCLHSAKATGHHSVAMIQVANITPQLATKLYFKPLENLASYYLFSHNTKILNGVTHLSLHNEVHQEASDWKVFLGKSLPASSITFRPV